MQMIATQLDDYITLPINEFCTFTGIGRTLCRQMLADGRLRAVRVGAKKILVDVSSYREMIAKQAKEGLPEYTAPHKAIETRKANRAKEREAAKGGVDLKDLGLL